MLKKVWQWIQIEGRSVEKKKTPKEGRKKKVKFG
jgi:hypothetical protein